MAARLRDAMDAAFWDFNVSSPRSLDGVARAVPGDGPPPLAGARAARTSRPQQFSFLGNAFPLGIIPSFSPGADKRLGSFNLQTLLLGPANPNWWVGVVGQFRPRKLITSIKNEVTSGDEIDFPAFKDIAKHFLDKSLFALGLFSQFALTEDTSLLLNVEKHGDRKRRRLKALLHHKLPNHDFTIEAASPEYFLDKNGAYWDVPSSVSVDFSSLISNSGLRYRFGLHKNDGHPESFNSLTGEVPSAIQPGICAKAAFSYEKSRDFWREKEKKDPRKLDQEPAWLSSYDVRLKEPHAAISGIIGGTCALCFRGNAVLGNTSNSQSGDGQAADQVQMSLKNRNRLSADLFGSLCYTIQKGKFKNDFNDLTRLDLRLDISSALAFIKGTSHLISDVIKKTPVQREVNPLAAPRLNMTLQQQVAGPIIARIDARVSPTSASGKHVPQVEDIMYSLSYSLRLLQSGKIMAWYSPKRKEAMIELRLFEF